MFFRLRGICLFSLASTTHTPPVLQSLTECSSVILIMVQLTEFYGVCFKDVGQGLWRNISLRPDWCYTQEWTLRVLEYTC